MLRMCYNASSAMEDDMQYKVGDKLIYDCPGSEDHDSKGVVCWIGEFGFEVAWDDGEKIDYKWSSIYPGSSIKRRRM